MRILVVPKSRVLAMKLLLIQVLADFDLSVEHEHRRRAVEGVDEAAPLPGIIAVYSRLARS
jgi:hypothetical protein